MTKHKPATAYGEMLIAHALHGERELNEIAKRWKAYPRLVEALREIVHPDMDHFRNLTGSNAAAINALLRELGELE